MPKSASSAERDPEDIPTKLPRARTRARRAHQLIYLAEDLLEERLRNGTASPTEVVAAVRLGTQMEEANIARVRMHTEYLQAQKAKAESETVREELFTEAIKAMTIYSGNRSDD